MSTMIDRIGPTEPVQPGKRAGQTSRIPPAGVSDTIDLSAEAVEMSENLRMLELAAAAPDVREDRVAEMKQKIDDPSWLNDRIIGATADRILDLFGF